MNKIIFPKINLDKVGGVLIDIDNTLYPYEPAHQKAIKACYDEFTATLNQDLSFEDFYKKYRAKRTTITTQLSPQGACRSRLFAFQAFFEEIQISHAFNHALKFETLYWHTFISHMQRSESAYHFLLTCKKKNIAVCAVSDMQAHFQITKLHTLNLHCLIDYLVTSEEAGVEKPDPKIFKMALRKLNIEASKAIMIGDHKDKDIKGAQALGIKSYLVETSND